MPQSQRDRQLLQIGNSSSCLERWWILSRLRHTVDRFSIGYCYSTFQYSTIFAPSTTVADITYWSNRLWTHKRCPLTLLFWWAIWFAIPIVYQWESCVASFMSQNYCKVSNIRRNQIPQLKCFSSRFVVVFAQSIEARFLRRKWRCSWSSADRRCSNYIWVIDRFIAH